jgi:photosystem II stability/assembly factor-like uncharacterized protein
MNKAFTFFAITILLSLTVNAQWRVTTPVGGTINDITFTDRYTGYAVFQSSGIGNCTVSHGLYKTIDEGENWIRMNTGNTNIINAVHFANQLTGWLATGSSDIRKTTDGGVTWTSVGAGIAAGNNDIWFTDVNNGFIVGNSGSLRRSTNGGSSWQVINSGTTANLRRIYFVNNNLGFIATSNGQLLRTTNGGAAWNLVTTGANSINDVFFSDAQTGFVCSSNNLFKSTDGGLNWSPVTTGATNPILRIFFPSVNVGYLSVDGEGIMKSTDGGNNWTLVPTMNGLFDTWRSLHFVDNHTGYACGTSGRINKTTDGGASWTNKVTGFGTELFTVAAPHKDTAYFGGREGKIFKTENGGINYHQQTKLFNGQSIIKKLYFLNTNTGFACSDSGRIFKTTDGGKNWVQKISNDSSNITDFSFINSQEGFAAAGNGTVLKTNDAGETWSSISTGLTDDFNGIWFINADTGFVISSSKIVRTFDAGNNWFAITPSNASSLRDIVFTNDSLGYCVGTFGKILFTIDAGISWFQTNNNSSNAEINEMYFVNDSTGYFAKQTSQSFTIDSCKTVGSLPTACLANNWTMNSIAMTDGGTYGYCAGGLNGIVHQTEVPEIIKAYTSTNTYCAGSSIFIAYHAKGFYGTGNLFTAQLSDASGSFTSPLTIGTYDATPTAYKSGIITATIPPGTAAGNYRIRVVASNPVVVSPDNGYDIIIQSSFTPTVSLQSNAASGACTGSTLTLNASAFAGGLNPSFSWSVNGQAITNNGNTLISNSLQNGDVVQVSMQSNLSCANATPVSSNAVTISLGSSLPLSLANDTLVCENSLVQLSAPSGYTYAWFPTNGLNQSNIANPVATISNSIQYTLTITDADGCTGVDSITINASPLPSLNLLADTAVCAGSVLQLSGPAGMSNYNWQPASGLNNATTANPVATINSDIVYELTVTDASGCSNSDNLSITAYALPQLVLSSDTLICEFTCVNLNASINSGSFALLWTPGAALSDSTSLNPIACPENNTLYTATVTDSNQCSQTASLQVEVINVPTPLISFDGITLSTGMADAYQWYLDGVAIPGATTDTYTPTVNGNYEVAVTLAPGCSSISSVFTVNVNKMISLTGQNSFHVYPNPAKDMIRIESLRANTEILSIRWMDAKGSMLETHQPMNKSLIELSTETFDAGLYTLMIIHQNGCSVHKVLVMR